MSHSPLQRPNRPQKPTLKNQAIKPTNNHHLDPPGAGPAGAAREEEEEGCMGLIQVGPGLLGLVHVRVCTIGFGTHTHTHVHTRTRMHMVLPAVVGAVVVGAAAWGSGAGGR